MRRKNWMGVYSLLLIVILSIFSGAANPILQPAVTAVCYDLEGVQRNALNSVDTDLCYDAEQNPMGYTFSDYKVFLMTASSSPQVNGKVTVSPQTTPKAPNSKIDGASLKNFESGLNKKEVTETSTADAKASPKIENGTEETSTVTQENPTGADTDKSETPTDTREGDAEETPVLTETTPVVDESEEPKGETPTEEITEEPKEETPTEEITEEPKEETPTEEIIEEPKEETPTEEITEEPKEESPAGSSRMMMMSIPMIGTINGISGVHPAQGEVYKTNEVTFIWEVDSAGVDTVETAFKLYLDGGGHDVTPSCGVTICQVTETVATGNHSWYVTAKAGTLSVSSSAITFSVNPATSAPSKPILKNPTGEVQNLTLIMSWLPVADASEYTLQWTGPGGSDGSGSLVATDRSCKDGLCTLPITFSAQGPYSWTVTATNSAGSAVSDPLTFQISAPVSAPGKPVLEMPDGSYTSSTVNFVWKPAVNAESYTVYWQSQWGHTGTKTLPANDATCLSGDCHISDTMPALGSYTWYVCATNSAGTTQSNTMSFNIYDKVSTPYGTSPSGTIYSENPLSFTFSRVEDNAYQYNVTVYNAYTGEQVADYYWNESELSCSGNYCTGVADSALGKGYYFWRVRARTNNSVSNYSGAVYFRNTYCENCYPYSYYYPNTVPTPYSPIGLIHEASPVFSWKPITGATAYWLTVFDATGKAIFSSSTDNSICNYQICTYSPAFTLPQDGNYTWKISGGSNTGVVWNYASAAFTYVGAEETQKSVTGISIIYPMEGGELYAGDAKIVWLDTQIENETYHLVIKDKDGNVLLDVGLDRESAWCDGKTCSIEFAEIPSDATYHLELTPISESGEEGILTELNFQVTDLPLDFAALYPAENQEVGPTAPFIWQLPSGTPAETQKTLTYSIHLIDQTRSRETVLGPYHCEDSGMICFNGGALYRFEEELPEGDYIWSVRANELEKVSEEIPFKIIQ